MKTYRTVEGDMVDAICQKYYGTIAPLADELIANPAIADYTILPSGITIVLPDVVTPAAENIVRLWD